VSKKRRNSGKTFLGKKISGEKKGPKRAKTSRFLTVGGIFGAFGESGKK